MGALVNDADFRLGRLQRATAAAALVNLMLNPVSAAAATIASPSSAPSTTGFSNLLPVSAGFTASFTGTITVGSKTITSVSSLSGVAVGQPLIEAVSAANYPTKVPLGAVITAIDTTAMTITIDRSPLAAGSAVSLRTTTEKINFYGSIAGSYGANLVMVSATGGNYTNPPTLPIQVGVTSIIEFETDVGLFTTATAGVMIKYYRNGNNPFKYRVAVDDVYQTTDPQPFDASLDWLTIQFLTPGVHKVRVEVSAGACLMEIWIKTGASVWKPKRKPVVGFFSDSWCAGGASGSWTGRNIASVAAELLGVEPFFCSVGGTGYVAYGGVNWNWASDYRIADTQMKALDAIVVFGSINDNGQNTQANNLACWQKLRTANPNIPISVFGVPTTVNVSSAAATALEAYQQAAFAAWADKFSIYHPLTGNPGGAILNANNLATMIAADGNHLADGVGTAFIGRWMARLIARDWGV